MKLVEPPVFLLQFWQGYYTVNPNVCDKQTGSVLPQKPLDGADRPVGYLSCSLTDAE